MASSMTQLGRPLGQLRGLQQVPGTALRVQRAICRPLCAKQQKAKGGGAKVNKRGKVSSRPGPGSREYEAAQQLVQPQGMAPADVQASAAAAAPPPPPQQQQPVKQQEQAQPAAASSSRGPLAETPQLVVDRMFRRVITFAGLPVLVGMVLFPAFWYLRVVMKVEYPLWVVYVTQATMFGGGLLGITYGILSTSWDPRREGTALGFTEFQANLPVLLSRNKQDGQ